MKKLVFFFGLAIILAGLLNSCGGFRPSSMNDYDDMGREERHNGINSRKLDDSLARANKIIDLTVKERSYQLITGADNAGGNGVMVKGLAVNNINRRVRWLLARGPNDPKPALDVTLAPYQRLEVTAPLGQYVKQYFEKTVKGEVLYSTQSLNIINEKIPNYEGTNYYFVLDN